MSSSIGITEKSFEEDKPVGGKVKPSTILGSIAGIAGPISVAAPFTAPLLAPISLLTGIGSAIAKIFGGGLTQQELNMVMEIKKRVDSRRDSRGVVGSPAN